MHKSSWVALGLCAVLIVCLGGAYLISRGAPEALNQEQATQMLQQMQEAVAQKNVDGIMNAISPDADVHLATLRPDQLRLMLAKAFRESGKLHADCTNIAFQGGTGDATLEFDLSVKQEAPNMVAEDYAGHITLRLRRVDVPHLLGLYHTKEWRIVGADSTGKDPSTFGDY